MTLEASKLASARKRLAFPLDYPTLAEARSGAQRIKDSMGVLKVGLELFVAEGPAAVTLGAELGMDVFLDLKLHDIPATVERAVASACALGARYLTLHAAGGPRMLEAAASRATKENSGLCLLAVTVLTSLDQSDLERVGVSASPGEQAERLGKLAVECGVGGLVCSPAEVAKLRSELGPRPVLVTPGIRPAGSDVGDQKRVGTPTEAIQNGSSLLVVGRPVRDAADPQSAALALATEVAEALGGEPQ
ncbi:MAG: orotidine-5'-phosphate decarboxylase [Polyangiaceae bacterium]|nr:orotidine-5'-phosphate decarboxylase [Polyangiaceae bacterium]MCB9608402.1 orotidine-5'-phosphate decarboxylase [Polyangiaceae bacterium]